MKNFLRAVAYLLAKTCLLALDATVAFLVFMLCLCGAVMLTPFAVIIVTQQFWNEIGGPFCDKCREDFDKIHAVLGEVLKPKQETRDDRSE